jgi:hypothetical protein
MDSLANLLQQQKQICSRFFSLDLPSDTDYRVETSVGTLSNIPSFPLQDFSTEKRQVKAKAKGRPKDLKKEKQRAKERAWKNRRERL